MDAFIDIFGGSEDITSAQICARAILIFVYGLILVRVGGRRIFGKWSALDIIVSIIIGSTLSRTLTGDAPLLGAMAATAIMVALHWVLSRAASRMPQLARLLEGRAIPLAEDGVERRQARHRNGMTEADMEEALREAGVTDVSRTRLMMLEPSGKITVLKR